MTAIRLISLIARVALMVTLALGLLYWSALLFGWSWLLVLLAHIGFPNIHEVFGTIGALCLLILGAMALRIRGSRMLGAGGMIYAILVPAFGMTQTRFLVEDLHWLIRAAHLVVGIGAMMLIQRIVKQHLRLKQHGHMFEGRTGTVALAEGTKPLA